MCICDLEEGNMEVISAGDWQSIFIKRTYDNNYYVVAKSDGMSTFKIKYCFECGRKLSEGLENI